MFQCFTHTERCALPPKAALHAGPDRHFLSQQSLRLHHLLARGIVLLLAVAFTLTAAPALAQEPIPVGDAFRVNTFTAGGQRGSTLAVADNGDFVVTWAGPGQDNRPGVYAQRYSADGAPQGSEFQVHTSSNSTNRTAPNVAMAGDGDFVIAWQSNNQDGSGWGIYARRYSADGTPQGDEFRVNTYTNNNQIYVTIGLADNGDFVIAWVSDGQDGSEYGVYAQRYSADGTPQGDEFQVNTYTDGRQSWPSIGVADNGDFVIAWQSWGQAIERDIYAQRYSADGTPQGSEFRVNTYTTNTQSWSGIAVAADGAFIITWNSFNQDGSEFGIYAQRYDADGTPQSSEFRVNTYTNKRQSYPSIAIHDDGSFVIAWRSEDQDGSEYGVYAQSYNAKGIPRGGEFRVDSSAEGEQSWPGIGLADNGDFVVAWSAIDNGYDAYARRFMRPESDLTPIPVGDEFRVNTRTDDFQTAPSIGVAADGDFVIAWESDNQDGSGEGIYAQRYSADGTPQGGEFRVNTFTDGRQWAPQIGMDADGAFVIAWQSNDQDGSGAGIYAQGYSADGTPQGSEFRVNTFTDRDQEFPSIDMADDGTFVVAWQSDDQDGGLFRSDVYAQRYSADGTPQGNEFRVNTFTFGRMEDPRVGMGDDGAFVIAWESWSQDGSLAGVYAQRYNADGEPQGGEFRANTYTDSVQAVLTVGVAENGDFVIAWQSLHQDGSGTGIYAQRFTLPTSPPPGPSPAGNEFRVNTFTDADQARPSIGVAHNGDFVVAWHSQDQDGSSYGIYAQRYSADGTRQGDEFRVNTFTDDQQSNPSIGVAGDGDFVVAWLSFLQDGSSYGIYAQRYSADGTPQGSEFQVNTYTDDQQVAPSVGVADDGVFVVTWMSENQDGSGHGIYARRYSADGTPQGSEFQVNTHTDLYQLSPTISLAADGAFVIAWDSAGQDGSGRSVHAQRYSADGTPQGGEFRVNTETDDWQFGPSIGLANDGRFVVAWTSRGQDGSLDGVYAQRYSADGTPQGVEFRVNTFTNGYQRSPSIAVADNGAFVVAWQSNGQDGSGEGVYAQYYSADGTPQGGEFQVHTYTDEEQNEPAVGMDPAGDFVIAWTSDGDYSDSQVGGGKGVYAQRFVFPRPQLTVSGQATAIPNGDSSPAPENDANFGQATLGGPPVERTFTIANNSAAPLYLLGDPPMQLLNNETGQFTVSQQPASPIAGGGSSDFTIAFSPTRAGVQAARVAIICNNDTAPCYTFMIEGEGAASGASSFAVYLPQVVK